MALNVEIWIRSILEKFLPSNSFVAQSVDHSDYVNGKTVHVPNAGAGANITKNRSSYPATVGGRTDYDLTYNIDKFEADPLVSRDLEEVELSYDKRTSMIQQSKENLRQAVMENILHSWADGVTAKVFTSGAAEDAHIPSATGKRKAMTKDTVMAVKKKMDLDDVPAEGRFMILDAVMYNQLLSSLTDADVVHFLAGANPETGVVGKYLGFDFYERSLVLKTAAGGTLKEWGKSAAATDSAAGLAWQKGCVSRAIGDVVAFENAKDATYYGDVFSFGMRAGGSVIRHDKKGVVLIYQDAE